MHLKTPVSLQINLAPGDFRHAKYILPHQLKILAPQVDEIILTIDTQAGKGRFAEGWTEYKAQLDQFLADVIQDEFDVKIIPVNYSSSVKTKIGQYFFGTDHIPVKDFRGGPFYAYFFGLFSASNSLVFHLDSDIFLGGKSQTWINEAVDIFKADASVFIAAPLPGPPHRDDILEGQQVIKKIRAYTWQLNGMSTRIFLMDKDKFSIDKPLLSKPSARNQLKAIIQGNSNAEIPERLIAAFMAKNNLKRVEFLGKEKGLWSLHPPFRTTGFYAGLPELINRIELNDLPEKQQGNYDIIDELCDWAPAREKLKQARWWKRK
jgi:hypothetical protein